MISVKSIHKIYVVTVLFWSIFTLTATEGFSQAGELNYLIAPTGNYMKWNDQSGMDEGFFYGGQLGFSFGRRFELSGVYMTSSEVVTNLGSLDIFREYAISKSSAHPVLVNQKNVDLKQLGGKLTFNLGSGYSNPYISTGTGILNIKPDNRSKSEQIYVSAGTGLKLNVDNNISLNIGAERLWYRYNPASVFLSDEDLNLLGVSRSSIDNITVGNWAITAGVVGLIPGKSRNQELNIGYRNQISRNTTSSGTNFVLEPRIGLIKFNDKLPYRAEQHVVGGSIGFDFGSNVGLHGFYLRGTEEEGWSNFDKFAMYGGEFKFLLSNADTGIIPFLNIGVGYIDVNNQYKGREKAVDKPFAQGGGGVQFILGDYLKISGSATSILMSMEEISEVSTIDNIKSSWMLNAGLSLTLGPKKNVSNGSHNSVQSRFAELDRIDEKMLENRIYWRLQNESSDSSIKSLEKQIQSMQKTLESVAITSASAAVPAKAEADSTSKIIQSSDRWEINNVSATTGFNISDKPFQVLLGLRADYKDVISGHLRFSPDLTLGFANTASYNLNANILADIQFVSLKQWQPYAGTGLGLLAFSNPPKGVKSFYGTFNLIVGAEKPVGKYNTLFLEYVNMNLFKFNRLQAGYRFNFAAK